MNTTKIQTSEVSSHNLYWEHKIDSKSTKVSYFHKLRAVNYLLYRFASFCVQQLPYVSYFDSIFHFLSAWLVEKSKTVFVIVLN